MEEVEGQVVVKADKRDLLRGRRAPAVLRVEVNEEEEGMVVIGGGAAGHTAVETLRFSSLIQISHRWLFLQEGGFPRPSLVCLQGASPAL